MAKKRMLKVNSNGKVYLSKVVRNGIAQIQFAEKIGRPVGACVKAATEGKSFNRSEQTKILHNCVVKNGVKGFRSIGTRVENGYYVRKAEGKVGHGQPYTRPF